MNFLKKHKNDIFLILVLLALSGGLLAWRELTKRAGGEAVVTVDGAAVDASSGGSWKGDIVVMPK